MASVLLGKDNMSLPVWTLVLAAGAGRRLAGLTGGVPRQFWSVDGGPSLLEQTVDRVAGIAPSSRRLTIVDRTHRRYVEGLAGSARLGRILYQPCDRGTAVGVLLGLHAIARSGPDVTIVLTPADQGVTRPSLFQQGVRQAAALVGAGRARAVLFGVEPDAADGDYGWITPGMSDGPIGAGRVQPVARFVEKPPALEALRLRASGAVWNTMVLVVRVSELLNLYRRHLPELTDFFVRTSCLPPVRREAVLAELYPQLPSADFSRDVLTPAEGLVVYTWPASLGWSDLGTPERLERWLRQQRTAPEVVRHIA